MRAPSEKEIAMAEFVRTADAVVIGAGVMGSSPTYPQPARGGRGRYCVTRDLIDVVNAIDIGCIWSRCGALATFCQAQKFRRRKEL
jgi:hypothetical protein